MGLTKIDHKDYAYILADGKIRVQSVEGDPEAVKREYETSDGKTGVKFEKVYDKIDGKITFIGFKDGDYGKQLQVEIDGINLMMNTNSNFGEDLMKKIPNVNLELPVELSPYNFTNDKGRSVKGISVIQNEEKITNYFYDAEEAKVINGYPAPEGDTKTFDGDDWKVYFTIARKFLIKYIEENIITKMTLEELPVGGVVTGSDDDEIKVEDLPM